jgi:hypothetical protein
MDRTTSVHRYNEFSSSIDLKDPKGIIQTSQIDNYIERALKPLIEEGKAFKHLSINQRTGVRTTRYAYQGEKEVQDSVNAVLSAMPDALGYKDTDDSLPVTISHNPNQVRYHQIVERILDPKSRASIKSRSLRLGGSSTTDPASGLTTTRLRVGLGNEARAMRQLVDDTDAKFLSGQLPSSALADGASPATVAERATARVARAATIEDATIQAENEFIKNNPTSNLAVKKAIELQKATDREEKQRILAAERDHRTPEFREKENRRLDARKARDDATLAWARKNIGHPMARAIIRSRRNRTFGGRLLNRAIDSTKMAAVRTVIGVIAAGVGVMIKFLSHLPAVASNIHKLANKGVLFDLPTGKLEQFRTLSRAVVGNDSTELIQNFMGSVHTRLTGVTTGNVDAVLGAFAPITALVGERGKSVNAITSYFTHPQNNSVDDVRTAMMHDLFVSSFLQNTLTGRAPTELAAFKTNSPLLRESIGQEGLQWSLGLMTRWSQIRDDAERNRIKNAVIAGGDIEKLMADYLGMERSAQDNASPITYNRALDVGNVIRETAANLKSSLEGILISILAAAESTVEWIRRAYFGILSTLNDTSLFKDRWTEELHEHWQDNRARNTAARALNNEQMRFAQDEVSRLGRIHGFETEEDLERFYTNYSIGSLSGLSVKDAVELGSAMQLLKLTQRHETQLTTDRALEGKNLVRGVTPVANANAIQDFNRRAIGTHSQNVERIASMIDISDLDALEALKLQAEQELAGWENQIERRGGRNTTWPLDPARTVTGQRSATTHQGRDNVLGFISAIESLMGLNRDIGNYYRFDNSVLTREIGEVQLLRTQFVEGKRGGSLRYTDVGVEAIRDRSLDGLMNHIRSGSVRVEVSLSKDNNEMTFFLRDERNNDLLGVMRQPINLIGRDFYTDDLYDTRRTLDALTKTPVR